MDKDKGTKDDVIGTCYSKIEDIIEHGEVILKHKGKAAGMITIKLEFKENDE